MYKQFFMSWFLKNFSWTWIWKATINIIEQLWIRYWRWIYLSIYHTYIHTNTDARARKHTHTHTHTMAQETGVQSQVESYKRLKQWYLIPPCLTLSIRRDVSRVKCSNPGKEMAIFGIANEKETLKKIINFTFLYMN